ncbi:MAG: GIY-YIG nuclease family protein [Promethearchaeota archaeon]
MGLIEFSEKHPYLYVGSAMGGLYARLRRHLSTEKKIRWHIDYLLERSSIYRIIYATTRKKYECLLSKRFNSDHLNFKPIKSFGNSDCTVCPSHLYQYVGNLNLCNLESLVVQAFESLDLKPIILDFTNLP